MQKKKTTIAKEDLKPGKVAVILAPHDDTAFKLIFVSDPNNDFDFATDSAATRDLIAITIRDVAPPASFKERTNFATRIVDATESASSQVRGDGDSTADSEEDYQVPGDQVHYTGRSVRLQRVLTSL